MPSRLASANLERSTYIASKNTVHFGGIFSIFQCIIGITNPGNCLLCRIVQLKLSCSPKVEGTQKQRRVKAAGHFRMQPYGQATYDAPCGSGGSSASDGGSRYFLISDCRYILCSRYHSITGIQAYRHENP